MNTTISSVESGGDKRLPETTVQSIAQNLTTIQSMQNVQSVVQSNIQNIQATQTIVGSVGTTTNLMGKSISMDTNPKLPLMKPVVPSGTTSTSETNKITTTVMGILYSLVQQFVMVDLKATILSNILQLLNIKN